MRPRLDMPVKSWAQSFAEQIWFWRRGGETWSGGQRPAKTLLINHTNKIKPLTICQIQMSWRRIQKSESNILTDNASKVHKPEYFPGRDGTFVDRGLFQHSNRFSDSNRFDRTYSAGKRHGVFDVMLGVREVRRFWRNIKVQWILQAPFLNCWDFRIRRPL